ncbi:helix-turn-helix domain-containing protein [Puniceicoccaceae bacterium]|nr:helix-turn-helix domain-containing protein [Puniceicoccaceae bacterium]
MSKKSDNASKGVKNLREVRKIAGLTQLELASLGSVAHASIRAIETGNQQYSFDLVKKLANKLGCGFVRGDREKKPGLLLTCIGSDEPYNKEWFDQWRRISDRRNVYAQFFSRYKDLISDALDASCELDFEADQGGGGFERADAVAENLIRSLGDILSKDAIIAQKMLCVQQRDDSTPRGWGSDADVPVYLHALRDHLEIGKRKYFRKLNKSSNTEDC